MKNTELDDYNLTHRDLPPVLSAELEDKNQGEVGQDLAGASSETLRAAQGDGQSPPLSWQVRVLEAETERLRNICGEIIATLRVNIERGTLKSDSPEAFSKIVNQWAVRIGDIEEPALAAVVHNQNEEG